MRLALGRLLNRSGPGEAPAPEASVHEGSSDVAFVNEAWRVARGNGIDRELAARQMEMTRRLIVALHLFQSSSDRWQLVLSILTATLILFAAASVYLAWALLQRTS